MDRSKELASSYLNWIGPHDEVFLKFMCAFRYWDEYFMALQALCKGQVALLLA